MLSEISHEHKKKYCIFAVIYRLLKKRIHRYKE